MVKAKNNITFKNSLWFNFVYNNIHYIDFDMFF